MEIIRLFYTSTKKEKIKKKSRGARRVVVHFPKRERLRDSRNSTKAHVEWDAAACTSLIDSTRKETNHINIIEMKAGHCHNTLVKLRLADINHPTLNFITAVWCTFCTRVDNDRWWMGCSVVYSIPFISFLFRHLFVLKSRTSTFI